MDAWLKNHRWLDKFSNSDANMRMLVYFINRECNLCRWNGVYQVVAYILSLLKWNAMGNQNIELKKLSKCIKCKIGCCKIH